VLIWKVYTDKIDVATLLDEPPDPNIPGAVTKASLSRFQWLIFIFVIAGLYAVLSIEAGQFIDIPNNVLGLLGISTGGFLVSKGISGSKKTKAGGDANVGK
jgi:hypothetical protein